MSREFGVAVALIAAVALLLASMLWSTTARGQAPGKTADVERIERAVTTLAAAKRAADDDVAAKSAPRRRRSPSAAPRAMAGGRFAR